MHKSLKQREVLNNWNTHLMVNKRVLIGLFHCSAKYNILIHMSTFSTSKRFQLNIYFLMNTLGGTPKDALTHRLVQPGIKPPTYWLVDELPYLRSQAPQCLKKQLNLIFLIWNIMNSSKNYWF